MGIKIGLDIESRRFNVDVQEDFADFLQDQMEQDFYVEGKNEVQKVLQAYVRKTHDLYELEKKMQKLLEKVENFEKS